MLHTVRDKIGGHNTKLTEHHTGFYLTFKVRINVN